MTAIRTIRRLQELDDGPGAGGAGQDGKALVWQQSGGGFVYAAPAPAGHKASHQLGGSDALALAQYDRDLGFSGLMAPSNLGWNFNSLAAVANRAYVMRFVPSRAMTIAVLAFCLSVAASQDDPCDVGIYDANWSRLVSAGATTGKLNSLATSIKAIAITSTALAANTVYYAALAFGPIGGTAASIIGASFGGNGQLAGIFGSARPNLWADFQANAYPLPASFTGSGGAGAPAMLAVRES
jgi:hypothetical protein